MKRISLSPRDGWQQKIERDGLTLPSPAGTTPQSSWNESAAYQFTAAEIGTI